MRMQSTKCTSVTCEHSTIWANRKAESVSALYLRASLRRRESPTIVALDPKGEGVENLVFNNFSTGTNTNRTEAGEQYFPMAR